MHAIKTIFGWIFRQALLFAIIIGALLVYAYWTQSRAEGQQRSQTIQSEIATLEVTRQQTAQVRLELKAEAAAARTELEQFAQKSRSSSLRELRSERARTKRALGKLETSLPSSFEQGRQVATADTAALATTALTRLEIAMQERKLDFIEESIAIAQGNASIRRLEADLEAARRNLAEAQTNCRAASVALRNFDAKWFGARWLAGGRAERRALSREKTSTCLARDAAKRTADAIAAAFASAREAIDTGRAVMDASLALSTDTIDELERQTADRLANTKDSDVSLNERYGLSQKARTALLILIGIIASPFLIRTLFYYVLAPIAERRAAIRIAIPGSGAMPLPPAEPSRISIAVRLDLGEELLVRQDFLQTSALEATKNTRWLLDYRHVLSSIASGLYFLTRITGGGSTTISAVRDPFAELAQITLPRGASCVLHPRALVALVQPVGETMRISSHWRLFSLNAWLTMQLRFMVFHGPGRLIMKGGRGARVEPAEAGRIFGQDQLIGFSADLAYSVTRAETFAPYLLGREQLFKDKIEEGGGVLIIEEAPLAGRAAGDVSRGLEGAFDAAMKAFGL